MKMPSFFGASEASQTEASQAEVIPFHEQSQEAPVVAQASTPPSPSQLRRPMAQNSAPPPQTPSRRDQQEPEHFAPITPVQQVTAPVQQVSYKPIYTLGKGENLDEILASTQGAILLDFYADWCGPCKKLGAKLHEVEHVAAQNGARIVKVNIDHHPQIKKQLRVKSLPTLVVVKNGREATRTVGNTSKTRLEEMLSL